MRKGTELTLSDFDQDGSIDVAIAADHRIGIGLGPLGPDTVIEMLWNLDSRFAFDDRIRRHLAGNGRDLWLATLFDREVWHLRDPHLGPDER